MVIQYGKLAKHGLSISKLMQQTWLLVCKITFYFFLCVFMSEKIKSPKNTHNKKIKATVKSLNLTWKINLSISIQTITKETLKVWKQHPRLYLTMNPKRKSKVCFFLRFGILLTKKNKK